MKRIYSRERYIGENREFEECDGIGRRIWERNKERRNMMNRKEERKTDSSRNKDKSRGRRV